MSEDGERIFRIAPDGWRALARSSILGFALCAGGAFAALGLFSLDRAIRGDGGEALLAPLRAASERLVATFPDGSGAAEEAAGPVGAAPIQPAAFAVPNAVLTDAARARDDGVDAACGADDDAPAVIGDVLSIRYFERATVPGAPGEAPTEIAFERLDLAAQTQVGPDGTASLPMIGRAELASHGLACIEARLERAAFEAGGFAGTVTAAFAARPPVLVEGAVARPGTYAFDPAMTVTRLLAQAGLPTAAGADATALADLTDRRRELRVVAAGLTLARARGDALLEGGDALALLDAERADILRVLGPRALADEAALLAVRAEERAARERLLAGRRATLEARAELLRASLGAAREEAEFATERRDRLRRLLASGSVTSHRHDDAATGALAARRVVMDRQDALAAVRQEIERAGRDHAVQLLARELEIRTATRDAGVELGRLAVQIDALDRRIDAARGIRPTDHAVRIERPDPDGAMSMEGDGSTQLRPGDLVRVLAEPAAAGARDAPLETAGERGPGG